MISQGSTLAPYGERVFTSKRHWPLVALAFAAPILVALQPMLPVVLEQMTIYGRLVVAPLLIAIFFARHMPWTRMALVIGLAMLTGMPAMSSQPTEYVLLLLTIIGSIVAFHFGVALAQKNLTVIWRALIAGVTIVNAITLVLYVGHLAEMLDLEVLFESTQAVVVKTIARFSLGNSIELPFVLTALLYAGIRLDGVNRPHVTAAALNLMTALVSQSRLVVVIAALIFLQSFYKTPNTGKAILIIAALLFVMLFEDVLSNQMESLWDRFQGNDSGSAADRLFIFERVVSSFNATTLMLGSGLTSSMSYMQASSNEYRSVESAALQIVLELGLAGALLVGANFVSSARLVLRQKITLISILLWTQLLLFSPLFSNLPFVLFALGSARALRQSHCALHR